MKKVAHYGVHHDENGVAHLMQGRGGTNAIGLKKKSPFEVKLLSGRVHCNHQVALATPVPNDYHWDFFMEALRDPLVQAMLPLPKTDSGLYYISDEHGELVELMAVLARMSSPIYSPVMTIGDGDLSGVVERGAHSNIQPTALVDIEARHIEAVQALARQVPNLPGKLILSGSPEMLESVDVTPLTTEIDQLYEFSDLVTLPWESLGAVVLRKFMRGEWPVASH